MAANHICRTVLPNCRGASPVWNFNKSDLTVAGFGGRKQIFSSGFRCGPSKHKPDQSALLVAKCCCNRQTMKTLPSSAIKHACGELVPAGMGSSSTQHVAVTLACHSAFAAETHGGSPGRAHLSKLFRLQRHCAAKRQHITCINSTTQSSYMHVVYTRESMDAPTGVSGFCSHWEGARLPTDAQVDILASLSQQSNAKAADAPSAEAEAAPLHRQHTLEQPGAEYPEMHRQALQTGLQQPQQHEQQQHTATASSSHFPPETSHTPQPSSPNDAQFAEALDAVMHPASESASGEISYDEYLFNAHGESGDNTPQQAEPRVDEHITPSSSDTLADNSAADTTAAVGPDVDTLWGKMSQQANVALDSFKQGAVSRLTPAQLKFAKQAMNFLGLLGQAVLGLLAAVLSLWGAWIGLRQFVAAVQQPAFHLSCLGIAVIAIITPQTLRNNQVLQWLSDSSIFANYGQTKRFLNIVTFSSVGLLFAGVLFLGFG